MRLIKKVNNNVAVCQDSSGRELVAFGKGIGFGFAPHDSIELDRIERTFYDISPQYLEMIGSLPADVVEFTAGVVDVARMVLSYPLTPNLLLTLSDHIAFAIKRFREGIYIKMPLAFDLEQMYPKEMELAHKVVVQINTRFEVRLPRDEASGVVLALINARVYSGNDSEVRAEDERQAILDGVTDIVEKEMGVNINRDTFNYSRFATHVRYLYDRLKSGACIDSVNFEIYGSLREESADVAACVDRIAEWLELEKGFRIVDEERLYLLLHINRVCSNGET